MEVEVEVEPPNMERESPNPNDHVQDNTNQKFRTMLLMYHLLSLKKMFGATILVLRNIASDRSVSKYSRGDASGALQIIVTFDFVFILLLMEKIIKITNVLCQTLQKNH